MRIWQKEEWIMLIKDLFETANVENLNEIIIHPHNEKLGSYKDFWTSRNGCSGWSRCWPVRLENKKVISWEVKLRSQMHDNYITGEIEKILIVTYEKESESE